MTKYPDLFSALATPFPPTDVKSRQQAGRTFHYITARTVMNRLDEVIGPENWWDEYLPSESSVLCKLSIRLPDGQVLTKQDAGGVAGMQDPGDDEKSGFSDALKRAAVKFGIARYLYRDGVPTFSGEPQQGSSSVPQSPSAPASPQSEQRPAASHDGSPPRSGRALFSWVKDQELKHGVGLLKYLNHWGKLQDLPYKMVDWTEEQVALAYQEACRRLQTNTPGPSASPASRPPSRPDGQAPADLDKLRADLIAAIWKAAKVRHATDKEVPEHYWVIAAEIDNSPEMRGEVIPDINTCNDPALLRKAIAVAERLTTEEIPF